MTKEDGRSNSLPSLKGVTATTASSSSFPKQETTDNNDYGSSSTRATNGAGSVAGESESHRIYWQQWLSSNEKSIGSRREWVTSSAAVRISPVARAADVTGLLRESLQLSPLNSNHNNTNVGSSNNNNETDALVLVGTLYSLSRDYVRFEHEHVLDKTGGSQQQQHNNNNKAGENGHNTVVNRTPMTKSSSSPSSDAFNVMHTLKPSDYPLKVRDLMADHLRKLQAEAVVGRTIIAPKLQWYYCPILQSSSPVDDKSSIPSCINLEGYCTSMEEDMEDWGYDDDDDGDDDTDNDHSGGSDNNIDNDENDSIDVGTVADLDLLASRFPWLRDETSSSSLSAQSAEPGSRHAQLKKQYRRETRRLNALAAYEASIPQGTLSGYLLKRSSKDMHVWRRVHCVLTDDYLWFVSRRYKKHDLSFAKHGRVRLTRALLLEPSADYAPLYRTPHAFEMVAADGTCHVFRAANRPLQRKWIKAISDRIIQSYENSLLESAQLIVNDECVAQARRIDSAMDQLWEQTKYKLTTADDDQKNTKPSGRSAAITPAVARVLRWSLKVTDFRHFCRHVRSTLPARSPVVVTSASTANHSTRQQPLAREVSGERAFPLDPLMQSMIHASWQQAGALLQQATVVGQSLGRPHAHRNLETLLRHVEFVITGRHHGRFNDDGGSGGSVATVSSSSSSLVSTHHDLSEPPPIDLLDALEKELQSIAASMP